MELSKENTFHLYPNHWSRISTVKQQVGLSATPMCPKHLHEFALKCIGCYLKQTSDHGMVMNPSSNVCKIDAYPDANFAGMYGHEDHTDPAKC